MNLIKRSFLLFIALILAFSSVGPSSVQAQEQSPWAEVFDENGDLRSDIVDLGVTTETPPWMSVDLPFDQSLDLEANYHRYQTAEGNIVILPSASTLFFMAMNPQESGLADSIGMMSNGYGGLITFLGRIAGESVDWNRLSQDRPQYQSPDQFWNAVLSGRENVWTWFSGFGFITTLLSMSWDDAALRTAYLMYLNGAANCASIPGGCSGVVSIPPPPRVCPESSIVVQQPTASIQKIAPNNPLVVGQDKEDRRGADIQVAITVPPVIFTWFEPIYEEEDVCRAAGAGETPDCRQGSNSVVNDGVSDTELVFKECLQHVEQLPDAVATLQATANLSADSKAWITGKLGQTHYGAHIYRESFTLIPGFQTGAAAVMAAGPARQVVWRSRFHLLTQARSSCVSGLPPWEPALWACPSPSRARSTRMGSSRCTLPCRRLSRNFTRPTMNDILILLGEWLASLPTYLLNGLLVTLYWLVDSAAALLSIGCAVFVIQFADRRIQERAMFRPTREGREIAVADPHTAQILTGIVLALWLLCQWGMGAPVPWIGAAMWLFGAIVLLLVRHQQLNTLWSIKSGIAIYALAVIGSRLYLTYTADLSPEQWAALIGSADSAATVLANTRGNVTTIILWALWLVIPLGYFAMLLQQVLLNPVSLVSPAAAAHELIERYRVRQ